MSVPVLTAIADPTLEADLVATFGGSGHGVHVVRRCVDLADLVATASAGLARAAVLSADLRRLDGDAVLIVGICPAQSWAGCAQRFAAARTYLLRHGASSVAIVRADAITPGALDSFWRGS